MRADKLGKKKKEKKAIRIRINHHGGKSGLSESRGIRTDKML